MMAPGVIYRGNRDSSGVWDGVLHAGRPSRDRAFPLFGDASVSRDETVCSISQGVEGTEDHVATSSDHSVDLGKYD